MLQDVRPIAVRSHLMKVIEKAAKMKLGSKLLTTEDYQSGFKAGVSTPKNLALLISKIAVARQKRTKR